MEDYVDIMKPNYQTNDLKDLQPAARAVFERRVKHHEMISNLLENNMIEVIEQVEEAPKNEEDKEGEDEKQQEEEKKEEKTLYDIGFVYRTTEKRLNPNPKNYVAGSFGFKDRVGEGVKTYLHAFYDPNQDSGTITLRNGNNVYKIINKTLAEIDDQPLQFKFQLLGHWLDVKLSADT